MSPTPTDLSAAIGDTIATLLGIPAAAAETLADVITESREGCCRIPTPCWLPQPSGTCVLSIAPGESAAILIRVSNCDWVPHTYVVSSSGHLAGLLTILPTTLLLSPLEERNVLVKVSVPAAALPGEHVIGPVVVRGCRIHAVRVVVHVTTATVPSKCTPRVNDCPDNIHHWYDHFYCPRPCLPAVRDPRPNDPAVGATHA